MRYSRWIMLLVLFVGLCLGLAPHATAKNLNVYYGMPRDLFDPTIRAFMDAFPDIKVNTYRAPTEELMATIELELRAGKPRADVIVSVTPQLHGLQVQYKALEAYTPKELGVVLKELRDPTSLLTPVGSSVYVIHYNNKRYSAQEAPKRWLDILNQRWTNQVVIADPSRSASVHTMLWFLTKYLYDKQGEPYGWKYVQDLRKVNPKYVASHGTIQELVQTGERPVAFQVMLNVMKSVSKGEPTWWTFPEEGSPAEVTAISILKGAQNKEEAKTFVDFLLTEKGQTLMYKNGGFIPVRAGMDFKFPDGRGLADVKSIPVDAAYLTPEKRQEHMQKFHEIMR